MRTIALNRSTQIVLVPLILMALAGTSLGVEFYLRADTTTKIMPDGQMIAMWGFALDSAFGAGDGDVNVPGPVLTVPPGDPNLTIHLDNNLSVPVSIVIPGQIATMTPVKFTDNQGRQRVRSFTHETEPGNTVVVDYQWNNLSPGTYLYHSGTHPAVQVQMGLYGCLKKDAASGQAYEDINYDTDVVLCFSEIDPALHDAVATGNYGPGQATTSTMKYEPKYFLINGQPYTLGQTPLAAGTPNDRVLLRFVNAGIETHVPVLNDFYGNVVAEDGYPYNYTREQYSIILPAAKTKDVIIVPKTVGTYPVYDRRLRLTNAGASPGGMLTYLNVVATAGEGIQTLEEKPIKGDLDYDGDVDRDDVRVFLKHWRHRRRYHENCLADLDGDGDVDRKDRTIMLREFNKAYSGNSLTDRSKRKNL